MCDLAETYSVLDYRTLPVRTLATLASGLRAGSRVRMAMASLPAQYTYEEFLLARISDSLQFLCWAKTRDGMKNRRRPEPLVGKMLNEGKPEDGGREILAFDTPEAFERARKHALRRRHNGNGDCYSICPDRPEREGDH